METKKVYQLNGLHGSTFTLVDGKWHNDEANDNVTQDMYDQATPEGLVKVQQQAESEGLNPDDVSIETIEYGE